VIWFFLIPTLQIPNRFPFFFLSFLSDINSTYVIDSMWNESELKFVGWNEKVMKFDDMLEFVVADPTELR
jgi:hypothetical protein